MKSFIFDFVLYLVLICGQINCQTTSNDPLCDKSSTESVAINSSAVINDKIFLFINEYVYESVININEHFIEINGTPKVYDHEWKYRKRSVFGVDRHYPICGSFGFQLEKNEYLDLHQKNSRVYYLVDLNNNIILRPDEDYVQQFFFPKVIDKNVGNNGFLVNRTSSTLYFYSINTDRRVVFSNHSFGHLRQVEDNKIVITKDSNLGNELDFTEGFIHADYWYLFKDDIVYIICPGIEVLDTYVRYNKLNIKDIIKCRDNQNKNVSIDCKPVETTNETSNGTIPETSSTASSESTAGINSRSSSTKSSHSNVDSRNESTDSLTIERCKSKSSYSWLIYAVIIIIVFVILIVIALFIGCSIKPKPKTLSPKPVVKPLPSRPKSVTQSKPSEPKPSESTPAVQPLPTEPESGTQPEPTKPESGAQPEPTKPESGAQPEPTKPESGAQPEPTDPEPAAQQTPSGTKSTESVGDIPEPKSLGEEEKSQSKSLEPIALDSNEDTGELRNKVKNA